jgi:heme oxygenase (biliverdin-IX-beta and delta-forming)
MNLLVRLKIETASAHDRIEDAFDLEGTTRSLPAYRELLVRLYGFHAAWEPRAELALADPGFFRERRKLSLLHADLRELGMNGDAIDRLAQCDLSVTMRTAAEAWGSMYVVEGSTLGGMIIARYVERRLGLNRHNGCRYFRCYGANVRSMWTSFGARLLARCGSAEEDAAVAAACRTFDTLHYWLCGR